MALTAAQERRLKRMHLAIATADRAHWMLESGALSIEDPGYELALQRLARAFDDLPLVPVGNQRVRTAWMERLNYCGLKLTEQWIVRDEFQRRNSFPTVDDNGSGTL